MGSSPGFMDEIHSVWSLKDMTVGREDFSTKNGDGARDLCRTQHNHQNTSWLKWLKVNYPMEFSLIPSNKYQMMFLFNFFILYINSEDCFLAVTVEVKGPYEYLTLEEYPLMIVSELKFFNLNIKCV